MATRLHLRSRFALCTLEKKIVEIAPKLGQPSEWLETNQGVAGVTPNYYLPEPIGSSENDSLLLDSITSYYIRQYPREHDENISFS